MIYCFEINGFVWNCLGLESEPQGSQMGSSQMLFHFVIQRTLTEYLELRKQLLAPNIGEEINPPLEIGVWKIFINFFFWLPWWYKKILNIVERNISANENSL